MNNDEIVEAIKKGMINAACDSFLMNFSSGGKINAEYVATVSIGQALLKSKTFAFDDEKIIFEYDTGNFLTSTVPVYKKVTPGCISSKCIFRKRVNTTRKGRIDIVLLENDNGFDYPKCAIEVKGNNPQKQLFIDDVKRNIEYLNHSDMTGQSGLTIAINCAFETFDCRVCATTSERDEKIKEMESKYRGYIDSVKRPPNIRYSIDVFSATETLGSPLFSKDEWEQIEDQIHLTLGVLIKFEQ